MKAAPKAPLKRSTLMGQRAMARWLAAYPFTLSGPAGVARAAAADPVREEEERFALALVERTLSWVLREGKDPIVWARQECARRAGERLSRRTG